jgi:hypothetical protein
MSQDEKAVTGGNHHSHPQQHSHNNNNSNNNGNNNGNNNNNPYVRAHVERSIHRHRVVIFAPNERCRLGRLLYSIFVLPGRPAGPQGH